MHVRVSVPMRWAHEVLGKPPPPKWENAIALRGGHTTCSQIICGEISEKHTPNQWKIREPSMDRDRQSLIAPSWQEAVEARGALHDKGGRAGSLPPNCLRLLTELGLHFRERVENEGLDPARKSTSKLQGLMKLWVLGHAIGSEPSCCKAGS